MTLQAFLKAYDLGASLFRNAEDYALLAEDCLRTLHEQGALYVEFFPSPVPPFSKELTPDAYMEGMEEGADRAEAQYGIISRFVLTGVRHQGPDQVYEAARYAANYKGKRITGFGMAGDERMYHPKDFKKAFDCARDSGLGLTVHAGEFGVQKVFQRHLTILNPAVSAMVFVRLKTQRFWAVYVMRT